MPKVYDNGSPATYKLLKTVMDTYHPELVEVNVSIGIVMVTAARNEAGEPTGPAITKGGNPVAAQIRKTIAKQRLHMVEKRDALIEIDADQWAVMEDDHRLALLDHELTHIEIRRDENLAPVITDDLRPALKLKPDDFALTGFFEVIKRHRRAALEYQSVKSVVFDQRGQGLFDFVQG